MKGQWKIALLLSMLALLPAAPRLYARDSSKVLATRTLWVDEKTGQVFIRPGSGRVPMDLALKDADKIAQPVSSKFDRSGVLNETQARQPMENELAGKVKARESAWQSYGANWQDKLRLGALFYGDYRFYTHTGFQPQELTQLTNPGVGNNNYNSFDITRTYINLFFFPTSDWTLRLTPNLYKTIGSANDTAGKTTGFGSNLDGNLALRMKYAYLQYNDLWSGLRPMKGGTLRLGEIPNPLVAWEEDLYGYRFVNLTPWNYLGLSSTQVGASIEGPVRLAGGEKTFIDYGLGIYNNSSFHAFEESENKQVMGRLTVYPFGADWRFQGLGLTGFYDYGYGNVTPDEMDVPTALKAADAHFERITALLHYSRPLWNAVGEFEYGQNAVSLANIFSGGGPADAFGTATGPAISGNGPGDRRLTGAPPTGAQSCTVAIPCYNAFASFGPQTAVYQAILQNGRERNLGFDLFGHYRIPNTKLSLFGMFQWFMPNDNVREDPLDFERFIFGLAYQYNEYLRFALDTQNVLFYRHQFGLSVADAEAFNYAPGVFNSRRLPSVRSFVIPNLVPRDTHSIFLNMEFAY